MTATLESIDQDVSVLTETISHLVTAIEKLAEQEWALLSFLPLHCPSAAITDSLSAIWSNLLCTSTLTRFEREAGSFTQSGRVHGVFEELHR